MIMMLLPPSLLCHLLRNHLCSLCYLPVRKSELHMVDKMSGLNFIGLHG